MGGGGGGGGGGDFPEIGRRSDAAATAFDRAASRNPLPRLRHATPRPSSAATIQSGSSLCTHTDRHTDTHTHAHAYTGRPLNANRQIHEIKWFGAPQTDLCWMRVLLSAKKVQVSGRAADSGGKVSDSAAAPSSVNDGGAGSDTLLDGCGRAGESLQPRCPFMAGSRARTSPQRLCSRAS